MDTQRIKDFFRDLFTLRTVWIDRGQGQWTVKRRFHPLLRGVLWTLALIVSATVYAGFRNASLPEPEEAIAETIEHEMPTEIQTQNKNLNQNQKANLSPSQNQNQNQNQNHAQTILPLKPIAMRREIILPSEMNPETDRIMIPVTKPEIVIHHEEEKPRTFNMPDDGKYRIFVSKAEHKLWLLNGNAIVQEYPIATGKNPGDKQRIGDNRTPTGNFKIVSIENASKWSHDFRDGKGKIKGAYGPWFLRLDAKGWKGIGIHGTHDPDSRGTNATEGCIRLSNEDIDELKQYAYKNMQVIIREN